MWARWALTGPYSEVVLVCLSVTGLRLKYTSLRIVYVPSSMCPSGALELTQSSRRAHDTMEDLEERRRRQARERVQRYRRRLSDERRQYDSERRRIARKQQSKSLRSLTARERDKQRPARHRSRQTTQQR